MAAQAAMPTVVAMPYATITHLPDQGTRQAEIMVVALGQRPVGLLANLVGEVDHGLWIVEVWTRQAQHDRFVAERLYPALHRSGRRLEGSMTHLVVAIHQIYLPSGALCPPPARPKCDDAS